MTHERDNGPAEVEFEEYLEGRSRITQGYRGLGKLEPPQQLDRAILRRASAAAATTRRRNWISRWRRWPSGLAVAAVATLVVTVTLRIGTEPEVMYENNDLPMAAPPADDVLPMPPPPPVRSQNLVSGARLVSKRYAATGDGAPESRAAAPQMAAEGLRMEQADEQETAPWRNDIKAWLEYIDTLIAASEQDATGNDAASRELAKFRDAWPDYTPDAKYQPWLARNPSREQSGDR